MNKPNRKDRKIFVIAENGALNAWEEYYLDVDSSWTDEEIGEYLMEDEYDIFSDYAFDLGEDDYEPEEEWLGNSTWKWCDADQENLDDENKWRYTN